MDKHYDFNGNHIHDDFPLLKILLYDYDGEEFRLNINGNDTSIASCDDVWLNNYEKPYKKLYREILEYCVKNAIIYDNDKEHQKVIYAKRLEILQNKKANIEEEIDKYTKLLSLI